jgi:predicted  nucleic acid-binding Zn-ribbon protein
MREPYYLQRELDRKRERVRELEAEIESLRTRVTELEKTLDAALRRMETR